MLECLTVHFFLGANMKTRTILRTALWLCSESLVLNVIIHDKDGSACGPVIVPVFKTGDRYPCDGDDGFDSHSLPPLFNELRGTQSVSQCVQR